MQTSYQFRLIKRIILVAFASIGQSCSNDANPFISITSEELASKATASASPGHELLGISRSHAVRFRTLNDQSERDAALLAARNHLRAACLFHDIDPIDWAAEIEKDKSVNPRFALEQLLCAEYLLNDDELAKLIRFHDLRTTNQAIRLECHRILWEIDQQEAYARARNLMFREKPRANNTLRPNYLDEVLLRIEHPLANELLIAIAAEESMESRARSLAIREVGSRKLAEASPIMESVFDTESTNFLIRKDALLVILEIDEPRGIAILKNKMPQRTSDLGMYTFMNSLREKHNVQ